MRANLRSLLNGKAMMTLKEFLCNQNWAVYKVKGHRFFGDTAFGPMWKDIPEDIEVPNDFNLDSLEEVENFIND